MRIYRTTNNDCFLEINIIELERSEPVLWFYNGMFCIIPRQVIKNAYDQLDMNLKMSDKISKTAVHIKWDQGIPVDPKVGYALLGE